MGQLLVLIGPPIVGVVTYILVRLIWQRRAREIVMRHDPSADGSLIETRRVYATLNQSNGTTNVKLEHGSRRGHTPGLAATYQRATDQMASPRQDRLIAFRTVTFPAVGALGGFALVWYLLNSSWRLIPYYFWDLISSAQDFFR